MQADPNPHSYVMPQKLEENPYRYTADSPQAAPLAPVDLSARVGEGQIALAWFVFFLMATFGGAFIGGIVGLIFGLAMAANGLPPQQISAYAGLIGFVLGIPISYGCFRLSLSMLILPQVQQLIDDVRRQSPPR
jgi:hypothetical protein